jgi:hypothetical protein
MRSHFHVITDTNRHSKDVRYLFDHGQWRVYSNVLHIWADIIDRFIYLNDIINNRKQHLRKKIHKKNGHAF